MWSYKTAGAYTLFFAFCGLVLLTADIVLLDRRIRLGISRMKEL